MFQTLKNAWRVPELKSKLLFTLLIIVVYRLGSVIPVPFVDSALITAQGNALSGTIFDYMSFLSGQAFSTGTLFALSVSPYITSSIVMQLLTIAIPALERMAKEGEEGKKKIAAITRVVTVALALITAFGYTQLLKSGFGTGSSFLSDSSVFAQIVIIACYCAGASLIMWLAERINEHGIGNGISMILFANIVTSIPRQVIAMYDLVRGTFAYENPVWYVILSIVFVLLLIAIVLAMTVFVIFITGSERRIPVQYAKRVVGRKMYGGQSSNLPIKLNMTGVMPVIFASSIVSLVPTILALCGITSETDSGWGKFAKIIGSDGFIYPIVFLILIIAFAYFYTTITFDPIEVANNLKKQGGAIPGIRQGRPTSDYIKKILNKITLAGALFLSIIAVLPVVAGPHIIQHIIEWILSGNTYYSEATVTAAAKSYSSIFTFGGTSLIIVIGVALETFRELEAQLTMRNYKGFL